MEHQSLRAHMKKLNGYRPSHRNKWRFIQNNILSIQELSLLEFYADIVDFDKGHDQYGLVVVDFEEIASIFRCSSSNTVRNWHNTLLTIGFIEKTEKIHVYKLVCHERYISSKIGNPKADYFTKQENNQPIEIILQSFEINLQTIKEKLQRIGKGSGTKPDTTTQVGSISIGSYKDGIGFISTRQPSLRSDREYQKIKEEMGPNSLSIEDMKWIDLNVKEDPNVPS